MAKNIERIGGHATNIAENVSYGVRGTPLDQVRPKGHRIECRARRCGSDLRKAERQ